MLQESVYVKMVLNNTLKKSVIDMLTKNKPVQGLVQVITITEKQFVNMINISGEYNSDVLDTDERLVIL